MKLKLFKPALDLASPPTRPLDSPPVLSVPRVSLVKGLALSKCITMWCLLLGLFWLRYFESEWLYTHASGHVVSSADINGVRNNLLSPTLDANNWICFDAPDGFGDVHRQGDALLITVNKAGGANWTVNCCQHTLTLQNGQTYTLSFRARSDDYRKMDVLSGTDGGDWHNVGLSDTVNLTPSWGSYTMQFVARRALPARVEVPVFSVGGQKGRVWVTDISLIKTASKYIDGSAGPKDNLVYPTLYSSDWPMNIVPAADGDGHCQDGVLTINILKVDGTDWHVQCSQHNIHLVDGDTYRLSFRACADVSRPLNVYSTVSSGDYHSVGLANQVNLGTEWQSYTMDFVAKKSNASSVNIPIFIVGNETGQVRITDVYLRKIE